VKPRVIIVDDSRDLAETIADGLADHGFDATAFHRGADAIAAAKAGKADVVVTDLRMPEVDGLEVLRAVDVPVIVMTAYGAIDSAVESIRRGAFHYLTKPFKVDELAIFVERALADRALRREHAELKKSLGFGLAGVIARSAAMQRVLALVERVAPSNAPVLLTGETGTGKTLIARALHGASPRRDKPFIAINCAALPEPLLESELFGHVKGAFTGAVADHRGLFASADGGTVLLDEIGELPLALQPKLLRVLETGTLRPVGATSEVAVDVRVVAATHRDLRRQMADGAFRQDLLYRLDVLALALPPLRHRREDLPLLVEHFLADARRKNPASPARRFSRTAMRALLDHAWPGNVRELAHATERAVLLAADDEITEVELAPAPPATAFSGEVMPIVELQRRYARWALDQCGGHKTRTAEKLDVDGKTLKRWLDES